MSSSGNGGHQPPQFDPGRRRFLTGVAGAAGTLVLPGCGGSEPVAPTPLPDPKSSGIDHIIVVMMENRSFDHYLGWLPGANGKQAGLRYYRSDGSGFDTFPLAPEFQNCTRLDPDHSAEGGRLQFGDGACDGFLLRTNGTVYPDGDLFPIGYYTQKDLGFFGAAAPAWTVYDNYFCAIMAETYPNRFYMHSAQTPQIHNNTQSAITGPATITTIWDRLAAASLTGTYYYNDTPFLGLWGNKYLSNGTAQPYAKFLSDAAAGSLPSVAYIDPAFQDEGSGTSRDDHPHADIRDGQKFLSDIYNAVVSSPQWPTTALFITYDEWGGFFDHVPPPETGVIPQADAAAFAREKVTPSSRLGFRVPTLAISPRARRKYISSAQYNHCSILKMIEWRWNLQPMTVRDAIADNIAGSFDFISPADNSFPVITAPAPTGATFGSVCTSAAGEAASARAQHYDEWRALKQFALAHGYPLDRGLA